MKITLALPVLALLLAGCGGGGDGLAGRDPNGARACEELAQAFENKDDTDAAIRGSFASGEAASQSSTPAIKDATIDVGGELAADPEAMVAACRAEGVDIPDVPS
jgi:hypothetical protein